MFNQDMMKFALIVGGLFAFYYVMKNMSAATPAQNEGQLVVSPDAVPQAEGPRYQPTVQVEETGGVAASDDPFAQPIPGNPESVTGAGVDRVNWDGLGENQLEGALSKQYQELTAEDLLPHNDIAHWADVYPNGVGQLQNKNFLHAGHHVGINTVGQHLKNPNLQLRSEPANPQVQVSP